ncbi:hypothetical protein [Polluticoccus soli]|uniref:hypothetical protein n=1 Tax=Polluticoccus soli TaxID=3034150 RepID=UPI0023E31119|nr:hypothetical protein [Flavipsychrobacter sp. JY13-12]
MTFSNTIKLSLLSILPLFATSCHKDDEVVADPANLVVTFNSPKEGQIVKKGETVTIDADINFNTEMHGYKLTLVNTANNQELMNVEEHAHADVLSVNKTWTDTLSSATDVKITLSVAIDHGTSVDKTLTFKSVPQ